MLQACYVIRGSRDLLFWCSMGKGELVTERQGRDGGQAWLTAMP
jgi:hypothetical protein